MESSGVGIVVRSLLFTDIEGSTRLLQRIGPRYQELLHRQRALIRWAVEEAGGEVRDAEGDSCFASFPSSSAAIGAAVAAQQALADEPWPPDASIRVRMGVHVGEVLDTASGLVGLPVHHAARIAEAAHGGQIVVSTPARALAGVLPPDVQLRSLGEHQLRDVGAVELHQVVHPDLVADFPALRDTGGARNNLPAPPTTLIGRTQETAVVVDLLAQHRLVTLTGAGGSGKTRLALHVASALGARYPDGVWLVDLSTTVDGAEVAPLVATTLGLDHSTGTDARAVAAALAGRCLLLVLDNCEHLLDACATLADNLVARAACSSVLATSREPLGVPGESVFRVPSLHVPPAGAPVEDILRSDAVRLFAERAALVRPGYDVGPSDAEAVPDICERLDGIPLAIELAAARVRAMSPSDLDRRLGDRFRLLTGGARTAVPRHRTLQATVDWSYRLLAPDEQAVLARLAVFQGGFDLDAAEAVVAGGSVEAADVLDLLVGLQDKSLLLRVDDNGATRYRQPETIRQYAAERLVDDPELEAVRDRHADWFAALAAQLALGPPDHAFETWVRRHEVETDNFSVAAEWLCDRRPEAAAALLLDLQWGAGFVNRPPPGRLELLRRASTQLPEGATRAVADVRCAVGITLGQLAGDAAALLASARAQVATVDDPLARAIVAYVGAYLDTELVDRPVDEAVVGEVIELVNRVDRPIVGYQGRFTLALRAPPRLGSLLLRDTRELLARHHWAPLVAVMNAELASSAAFLGHSTEAVTAARAALPALRRGGLLAVSDLGPRLALVEGEHGDLAVALALAEDVVAQVRSAFPGRVVASGALGVLAQLRLFAGDLDGAEAAAVEALEQRVPGAGLYFVDAVALVARSAVLRARRQPDRAAALFADLPPDSDTATATDRRMRLLEEQAAIASDLGHAGPAADLLATADEARLQQGMPVAPARRAGLDTLRARQPGPGRVLAPDEVTAIRRNLAALATVAR